jgi:hypothetical protein
MAKRRKNTVRKLLLVLRFMIFLAHTHALSERIFTSESGESAGERMQQGVSHQEVALKRLKLT